MCEEEAIAEFPGGKMTAEPLPADHVACYNCGSPTPAAEGPVCWACRRDASEISSGAAEKDALIILLKRQAEDVARIRRYVFFLAFVTLLGLIASFLTAVGINQSGVS